MTTRVTEGGCRPRFSRLATSPLNARARALPLQNLKKETARSLGSILNDNTEQNRMPAQVCPVLLRSIFI